MEQQTKEPIEPEEKPIETTNLTKKKSAITWFINSVILNMTRISDSGTSIAAIVIAILSLIGLGALLIATIIATLTIIAAIGAIIIIIIVAILTIIFAIGGIIILIILAIVTIITAMIIGTMLAPTIILYAISTIFNYNAEPIHYIALLTVWAIIITPTTIKTIEKAIKSFKNS